MNLIARRWTNVNKKPAISNGFRTSTDCMGLSFGGDEGDRTPDLGIANAALSQLSYIPGFCVPFRRDLKCLLTRVRSIYDPVDSCQVLVESTARI
jgi:hypothetical protein